MNLYCYCYLVDFFMSVNLVITIHIIISIFVVVVAFSLFSFTVYISTCKAKKLTFTRSARHNNSRTSL